LNLDNRLLDPEKIEARSFEIIEQEMGGHTFTPEEWKIVRRIIHATADFDLGRSVLFHPEAIRSGIQAIRRSCGIVADVQMVQAGISKTSCSRFGNRVYCFIGDRDVARRAKAAGLTRAIVSMRKARKKLHGGIVVIGNAPTALLEVIRLVQEGSIIPALIIGVPVGFVSAAEAKEELAKLQMPYITNRGRKGGTPVAVAAVNALLGLSIQG
jgi:precorrin-8X/cobalt-precorrin-8 methylmutase